jgi:serine protease AprX
VATALVLGLSAVGSAAHAASITAIVHPRDAADRAALVRATRAAGRVAVVADLPHIGLFAVSGPPGRVAALAADRRVASLEADRPLEPQLASARWATRVAEVSEPAGEGPLRLANGTPIDGRGIGLATIDTGIVGSHPDLAPAVARSYKAVCPPTSGDVNPKADGTCLDGTEPTFVEVDDTDDNGHGTHVAGIAVGRGLQSNGLFHGVAPGASLYAYSAGAGIALLTAVEAMEHILANNSSFSPRIRVVNCSFGGTGGNAHDPTSALSIAVNKLVASSISVVFSAGNTAAADDNFDTVPDDVDKTNPYSKNPTPGVMGVANLDDKDAGARDEGLTVGATRGRSDQPETWPDISAPGTLVSSTCPQTHNACSTGFPGVKNEPPFLIAEQETGYQPWYARLTGTSMAAPHVSGTLALLYQADPTLTPAQAERLLQRTAYKPAFGAPYAEDPQNPDTTGSPDKGSGVLDAVAALEAVGAVPAPDPAAPAQRGPAVTFEVPAEGSELRAGDIDAGGTLALDPAPRPRTTTLFSGDAGDAAAGPDLDGATVSEAGDGFLRWSVDMAGTPPDPFDIDVRLSAFGRKRIFAATVNGAANSAALAARTPDPLLGGPEPVGCFSASWAPITSTLVVICDVNAFGRSTAAGREPVPRRGVLHNIRVTASAGSTSDHGPGGTNGDDVAAPRDAAPVTIVRADQPVGDGATVRVRLDAAPFAPAAVSAGTWSATLDGGLLTSGAHTITAELVVDGRTVATAARGITVPVPLPPVLPPQVIDLGFGPIPSVTFPAAIDLVLGDLPTLDLRLTPPPQAAAPEEVPTAPDARLRFSRPGGPAGVRRTRLVLRVRAIGGVVHDVMATLTRTGIGRTLSIGRTTRPAIISGRHTRLSLTLSRRLRRGTYRLVVTGLDRVGRPVRTSATLRFS